VLAAATVAGIIIKPFNYLEAGTSSVVEVAFSKVVELTLSQI
jgi:hypothetical protein